MVRPCNSNDMETIYAIINDAAKAYKGIIPEDRWHEPYMWQSELVAEVASGVDFWGYETEGVLVGVMGIQDKGEVFLIRHAYTRTSMRNQGIGSQLLQFLYEKTDRPVLIGTWAAAQWAIRFYEKHGFQVVSPMEKEQLLRRFWTIPDRQVETSVVLADARWKQLAN